MSQDLSQRPPFGRLTAKRKYEPVLYGSGKREGQIKLWIWECRCSCGKLVYVRTDNLTSGHTQSCGCHRRDQCSKNFRKHGESHRAITAEYHAWCEIRKRCYDPNWKQYADYGGRGIRVCKRWQGKNGYENFLADLGRKPSPEHSLDRRKNNGNYGPGNCFWATRVQQGRNKRNNRIIQYKGQKRPLAEWSEITGLKAMTIHKRLKRGWSVHRALTTPVA